MINLLSQEYRKELRAAHHNQLLSGYLFALGAIILLLIASTAFSYFTLSVQQRSYQAITESQQPEKARYQDEMKLAKSYEKDLSAAKMILKNEVKYSEVLIQIAKILPPDVRLAGFDITTENLQKPLELSIVVDSYDDAVSSKEAFLQSNYFDGAKLLTIDKLTEGYGAVIVTKLNQQAFIELRDGQ